MAFGTTIVNSETGIIGSNNLQYQEPDAFESLLPNALDDICVEFSRYSTYDKVYGYVAIENMMLNVLYTMIGERDFEPTFGSRVINLLFEPNTVEVNIDVIEVDIYDRVRFWVPYIDLVMSGIIVQSIPESQAFQITIAYTDRVRGISRVFNAFLDRNSFRYAA